MQVKNQFSKYANEYKTHNIIQQIVAKSLVRELKSKPKRILELGCGSGQVFSNIFWEIEFYKAID
ncbi:methyltransferase, partial [Aliarcobacter butzleri]